MRCLQKPLLFTLSALLMAILLPACSKTNPPRGAAGETPVALKQFVLYDAQPRGGGDAVWAKKDGSIVIQVVKPKGIDYLDELLEKRYHLKSRPWLHGSESM